MLKQYYIQKESLLHEEISYITHSQSTQVLDYKEPMINVYGVECCPQFRNPTNYCSYKLFILSTRP